MAPAVRGKCFHSNRYDLLVGRIGAHPCGSRLVETHKQGRGAGLQGTGAKEVPLSPGIQHILYDNSW